MKTRIISGIIGIILLLLVVMTGGIALKLGVLIISIIGIREFKNAFSNINIKITNYLYLYSVVLFSLSLFNSYILINFSIIINFLIIMFIYVFNKEYNINEIGLNLLASIYIPFSLVHISLLSDNKLIWLIFIIAFSTDTFAYFTGRLFGKRKLAKVISPNKTIEGAIGGLIGSILATLIFVSFMNLKNLYIFILLAFLCSLASMIGDLTASKIKRYIKIKDYGNIMPGHGGVLDRFDSILFIAPLLFYFINYFI
ncbi:MAG: phosphatidate cytidylyltransferase [Senegalia sp. (in: firmicutes)]|uniref:phosphatidate cytidylyltransferase n=1 Tax=Senegalia sp. (in: firmicutes) TaxID=1924098 RepID=UPI003F986E7C